MKLCEFINHCGNFRIGNHQSPFFAYNSVCSTRHKRRTLDPHSFSLGYNWESKYVIWQHRQLLPILRWSCFAMCVYVMISNGSNQLWFIINLCLFDWKKHIWSGICISIISWTWLRRHFIFAKCSSAYEVYTNPRVICKHCDAHT